MPTPSRTRCASSTAAVVRTTRSSRSRGAARWESWLVDLAGQEAEHPVYEVLPKRHRAWLSAGGVRATPPSGVDAFGDALVLTDEVLSALARRDRAAVGNGPRPLDAAARRRRLHGERAARPRLAGRTPAGTGGARLAAQPPMPPRHVTTRCWTCCPRTARRSHTHIATRAT